MARKQQNEGPQMEDVILAAAEELFLEQGFAATTTAQIAQKAGCNSALVHYYYRTKEKLFAQIFSSRVTLYVESTFAKLPDTSSIEELVRYVIDAHWEFLLSNQSLGLFMVKELLSDDERLRELLERQRETKARVTPHIAEVLASEAAAGRPLAISPEALIQLILTLDFGYFYAYALSLRLLGQQVTAASAQPHKEEVLKTVLARLEAARTKGI